MGLAQGVTTSNCTYNNCNLGVNSSIIWVMNEVIDPITVNDSTVYLSSRNTGWSKVPGSVSLSNDGKNYSLGPNCYFRGGKSS